MNQSDTILLSKEELEAKAQTMGNELITIPLYDSARRILCIKKHLQEIQKEITRRIMETEESNDEEGEERMSIKNHIIADQL